MKGTSLWAGGVLLLLCGCVSLFRESATERHDNDLAVYGLDIIRPGMTKAEVDAVFGSPGKVLPYTTGGQFVNRIEVAYSDIVVEYSPLFMENNPKAKVEGCRTSNVTQESDEIATHTDAQLVELLHVGMSPAEVARKIGNPFGGYENEPGKVFLVHPQPGILIDYEGGKLKSWRRCHHYDPRKKDKK